MKGLLLLLTHWEITPNSAALQLLSNFGSVFGVCTLYSGSCIDIFEGKWVSSKEVEKYITHPAWKKKKPDSRPSWTHNYALWYKITEAAFINSFIWTMDRVIMCNVKGVARNDKPTKNRHPTLQLPRLGSAFSTTARSFGFMDHQLLILIWFTVSFLTLINRLSSSSRQLFWTKINW